MVLDCCKISYLLFEMAIITLYFFFMFRDRILGKLESGRGKWDHHLIPTEDPDKADVLVDSDSDAEPDPSPPLPGFSFKSPNKGFPGLAC